MTGENVLLLDPATVDATAALNPRFSLKPARVNALATNIRTEGRVLQPVGVVPIPKEKRTKGGPEYRLLFGFYRHAAVSKLNSDDNMGMPLPAMVIESENELAALKTQISENLERESLSPLDKAVAMKRLLDGGMSRVEVRQVFSGLSEKGGTKPLSNAMLNIYLRFLDLPKSIQAKIHDGLVGVEAAYELGKVAPEKRAAVLARAESDRKAQLEKEDKDEQKYLEGEKKLQTAEKEAAEAGTAEEKARLSIAEAEALVATRKATLKEVEKSPYLELDEAGKEAVKEKLKAASADVKAAEKLMKDAKNELATALKKKETASELATRRRAELENARKAKSAKGKGKSKESVGRKDVQKAAEAEGSPTGIVALSLSDIRQGFKDVSNHKGDPKVAAIGKALVNFINGKTTPKLLMDELSAVCKG